jgi:hypothetical protein
MKLVGAAFLPQPEGIVLQSVHPSVTAVEAHVACKPTRGVEE